jgi:transcriptional regulator with XRE-family HTH domain
VPTVIKFEFQEVGEQLLLAMKRLGLTQYELAKQSGVSRRQIGMAFKGANITLDTLAKIANVLRLRTVRMRDMEINYESPISSGVLARAANILDGIGDQAEQVKVLLGYDPNVSTGGAVPDTPSSTSAFSPAPTPGGSGRSIDLELMERAYELVKAIAGASSRAANQ